MGSIYISLTETGVAMLLTIIVGFIYAKKALKDPQVVINHLNRFVFMFALPSLLFKSFIKTDLENVNWAYANAFIAGHIASMIIIYIFHKCLVCYGIKKYSFIVLFFLFEWPNFIIFGNPILTSIDPSYEIYPVLASISNFIRFPFVFFVLEKEKVERMKKELESKIKTNKECENKAPINPNTSGLESQPIVNQKDQNDFDNIDSSSDQPNGSNKSINDEHSIHESNTDKSETRDLENFSIWKEVGIRLLKNVNLWAIFLGIIYMLTGLPVPKVLLLFVEPLASCTVPVSLFAIGIFICGKRVISCSKREALFAFTARHFLFPAMMLLIARIFGLGGDIGMTVPVLSTVPLALITFTLTHIYGLGVEICSTTIVLGTCLILPITLFWVFVTKQIPFFS
ncbi:auxin efflux carrier component 1b-related [Anaeramoeba flamelloides]|uniref:Auxin efflux carrier component 1b-related n=1 Tax=Anaeramoeba flamelloides TaxID=1746091 RepID=A0ABQ8XUG3_9EUKA|nr:auxin efflux carrier component 1b-related [Anaeramoeba flamelloides]